MTASGSDNRSWMVAWGKAPAPGPGERALWLPLHVHLTDSGEIARRVWATWLGAGVRASIARDADYDEIPGPRQARPSLTPIYI